MDTGTTDNTDRILLGVCAALWLGALGAVVAATVALVDLGRGHPAPTGDAGTPWLLYTVIAVSALVIIAAVPLLLRARREAAEDAEDAELPLRPGAEPPAGSRGTGGEPPLPLATAAPSAGAGRTAAQSAPRSRVRAAVDQLALRCGLAIGCAVGAAILLTGVATYLMAVDVNGVAWACYGLAAVITVAMPVIPWWLLRELRDRVDVES